MYLNSLLAKFTINSKYSQAYKTYITQEMLEKILASNGVYMSIAHDQKILKKYEKILDKKSFIIFRYAKGENYQFTKYLNIKFLIYRLRG